MSSGDKKTHQTKSKRKKTDPNFDDIFLFKVSIKVRDATNVDQLPYIQKNLLAENFAITLWLSKLASFISLVACFERNWLVKN